jgi:hypothetical protein
MSLREDIAELPTVAQPCTTNDEKQRDSRWNDGDCRTSCCPTTYDWSVGARHIKWRSIAKEV